MTAITRISFRGASVFLWKRAPLWRFSIMSATLLTLLFILFPPHLQSRDPANVPIPEASYVPPSQPPKPEAVTQPAASQAATGTPAAAPTPQNAELSLATPDNAGADAIKDETGIDPAVLGHLYSGSLKMAGFDIPLPSGKWVMFANGNLNGPKATGKAYFLGPVIHRRLVAGLIVRALKPKSGESLSPLSPNVATLKGLYRSDQCTAHTPSHACWIIYGLFTTGWRQWGNRHVKMDSLTRAALGDMAAKGVAYPQDLIIVQFMQAEERGYLEVAYSFNPEAEHITTAEAASPGDTDWAPANIQNFPEKVRYVEKLKHWGTSFWPKLNAAFEARIR